jgi:hypothetical protein
MADIDKTLPNIRRPEDEVAEEVNVEEIQESNGPVEITDEEDGGATIDFDPNAVGTPQDGDRS